MREINEIIVHCSATPDGERCDISTITEWHKAKGWKTVGYHFVIQPDGEVQYGRPIDEVGAHVRGHNAESIGICLIGGDGSNPTDAASDHFSPVQIKRLHKMVNALRATIGGDIKVSGHNQYANKACPGFQVSELGL